MMAVARMSSLMLVAFAEERALLSQREVSSGTLQCDSDFDQLRKGDTCVSTWSKLTKGTHQLRATEPWIGRANVARQLDSHFSSVTKADKWFGKHTFPAVIGDEHLFLTDYHHHAFAVNLNGDIHDLDISFTLVDDFRGLGDAFWPQMRSNHYNMLWLGSAMDPFAMPQEVGPDVLPDNWDLANFPDSLWRSLASFSGDNNAAEEERCFIKTCDYFLEYQWGYVMQVATLQDQSLWPDVSSASAFLSKLQTLPVSPDVKDVDLAFWKSLGDDVLSLCHSTSIRDYPLPDIFELPTLKGWATVPLPADPICDSMDQSFSLV
jgi:hypothetical protein